MQIELRDRRLVCISLSADTFIATTTDNMNSLFASIFRRAPQVRENLPIFPYTIERNPYTCKRTWPPDFTQLSPKHKFRLERRYRRRAKLKWARPQWTKFVKLSTWASIAFVCVYGVLFLEIDEGRTPFDGVSEAGICNGCAHELIVAADSKLVC